MNSNGEKNRIRFIFFCFLLFALVLIVRLYYVQVIHGQVYVDKADRQYVSPARNIFDRGNIYFSDKDGSLLSVASLSTGYIITINPQKITDGDIAYASLSKLLPLDLDVFYSKVNQKNSVYQKIADHVPEETMKNIEALKISGLSIEKERWRYYPGDSMAARILGFVGYDGDDLVGRSGLEKYYEDVLSRKNNQAYVNFFAEIFSNIKQTIGEDSKMEGEIITSIEPGVESFFEKKVAEVSDTFNSKLTGGIIIDPNTGEIYAMAVSPTFNLNKFSEEKDLSVFNNPLVEGLYEMGSIIKPLTMAAGLDSGAVTAATTYNDTGSLTMDTATIYNYDKKARGVVNMQEVLNQSLNLGVSFVVKKMGKNNFADYMRNYGLAEETGIDLPGENHGRLDNLNSPRDIEYATASYGQGISMTPVETVRALSTLANGGKLIVPHVVKRINYTSGLFNNISYVNEAKQVLKKETSDEISRMLTVVVDKALANGKVSLPNYSVAAKTGTAQIAKPGGGYYDDRWLHSFFGYFPSYDPRFLIFLYTVEPKNVSFASQTLTTPFMDTVRFLINYYNIAPDR
jgi:cell division protein FtsI (penicillin-binding protein 3)/stage V sporulation protein D (sporulation-specific penicillin-binding protein)